jgi:ATP-dependent DNA helicase RecG
MVGLGHSFTLEQVTDRELEEILYDLESDTVERTVSVRDTDKFGEAICAFANDLPDHRRPGVLFVGVDDGGNCAGIEVTDQLLQNLAAIRSDGNLLPQPSIAVEKRRIRECDVAVVTVQPASDTPVRYKGVVWIRVGPRRARASPQDERLLIEKRRYRDQPFDLRPVSWATLEDIDLELFERTYLPASVSPEVMAENERDSRQKLSSLRLFSPGPDGAPTVTGLLAIGRDPIRFLGGAYIQFLRIDGLELTDSIQDQKVIDGPIPRLIEQLDDVLKAHNSVSSDFTSGPTEVNEPEYPIVALQQIARNAVMHRVYEGTNAPIRITWFRDRIEISSPGGPYGDVTAANFGQPGITDYRNRHIAEVMSNLGYVQRFGVGIALARREMQKNGNPPIEFNVSANYVLAILRRRPA